VAHGHLVEAASRVEPPHRWVRFGERGAPQGKPGAEFRQPWPPLGW